MGTSAARSTGPATFGSKPATTTAPPTHGVILEGAPGRDVERRHVPLIPRASLEEARAEDLARFHMTGPPEGRDGDTRPRDGPRVAEIVRKMGSRIVACFIAVGPSGPPGSIAACGL